MNFTFSDSLLYLRYPVTCVVIDSLKADQYIPPCWLTASPQIITPDIINKEMNP